MPLADEAVTILPAIRLMPQLRLLTLSAMSLLLTLPLADAMMMDTYAALMPSCRCDDMKPSPFHSHTMPLTFSHAQLSFTLYICYLIFTATPPDTMMTLIDAEELRTASHYAVHVIASC